MPKVSREAADLENHIGLTGRTAKAGRSRRFSMGAISGLSGAALPATHLTQLLTDVGFSAVVNGKSYSAGVAYWDGAE